VLQPSDAWFAMLLLAVAFAVLPLTSYPAFDRVLKAIDAIASRPALAVALCAALSFFGSIAVALTVAWPVPRVHDEFSYLLAADTFAHGRLTNPTHPLWQHFESFHIFHEPTYASKYPPAQGAVLALGIVLAGEPLVGVWLSGALMCGAICWLLYGVVSQRWALLGGIAATLQIAIATKWTQTYWGGALAAAGGALMLGGAFRLVRHARPRDAVVLFGLSRDVEYLPDIHTAWGYDLTGPRRAETVRSLLLSPNRDLVVVRYGPHHVLHHEWVYNGADIDASEIAWARDMGPAENQRLFEYFRDRRIWLYREGFGGGEDGLTPYF